MQREGNPCTLWIGTAPTEDNMQVPQISKNWTTIRSSKSTPECTSRKTDMCSAVSIAALFTTVKSEKQLKHPPTDAWIRKIWYTYTMEYCVLVAQSCPTLCDPTYCDLPGSSVHGILQPRILEWVAISFSRRSSRPRDQNRVSCIVGRHFTVRATREVSRCNLLYIEQKIRK